MLSFNPQSGSSTGTDNQEIPGKNKCKKEGRSIGEAMVYWALKTGTQECEKTVIPHRKNVGCKHI